MLRRCVHLYHAFFFSVEPPHGADPEEFEQPALMEIKSSSAGPTVWSEFSALAAETGAINLGQVCVLEYFVLVVVFFLCLLAPPSRHRVPILSNRIAVLCFLFSPSRCHTLPQPVQIDHRFTTQ